MHGPVDAPPLVELPRAVERVDDPEPALVGDVLEQLLRTDKVSGIEPVEFRDEEVVRHVIAGRTEVAREGGPGSSINPARQAASVARCVLPCKVVGPHGPLF